MARAIPFIAWLLLLPVGAGADLTEPESLRNLDGVMLVVERLHPDAEQVDLSRAVVELDVRRKLRNSGIPILSAGRRNANPRRPFLYVNCNLMYVDQVGMATFSIDIELHQRVTLEGGEKAQGLTWAKSYLGVQGKDTAAQKVRDVVGEYLDLFIADYRHANADTDTKESAD